MEIKWKDNRKEKMQINQKGEVVYLTYPALSETGCVVHGFSTRQGGVSEGIFSSMNLSFTRGDKEEAVRENYQRIADAIGFSPKRIVCSDQTHTTRVRKVTEADAGNGITKSKEFFDVDGLVTNVPGLVLATFYADCVPLYLVDPVNKAIGLAHSGWRGTVGKIGLETVRTMEREFQSCPEKLIAAIGPSICMDCYEVSEDVAGQFSETLSYKKENGKYQLDLWEANRQIFLEAGIAGENIHLPNLCTCCNPDFLFSHRASKGKRGNLAAFLALKTM